MALTIGRCSHMFGLSMRYVKPLALMNLRIGSLITPARSMSLHPSGFPIPGSNRFSSSVFRPHQLVIVLMPTPKRG